MERGEVIDRGVAVAKERWETSRDEATSAASPQEPASEADEG